MLIWLIMVVSVRFSTSSIRSRRQASLAVNQQDIPITLRSLITCLTPGIRENLCFGPRVEVLKNERLGLTERRGAAYGYLNGVDIGQSFSLKFSSLLKPYNVPMIEDETEVGHHIGAVVDVTDRDGAVEFGDRLKVFKAFRLNNGGIAEWDREGAGVDIGSRLSAADDLTKVRWTAFGINVGPTASRSLVGPSSTTLGLAKGAALKSDSPFPSLYRNYYNNHGDWYRNQFYRQGDEYKTSSQRACPWCFAVDSTYPVQRLFA
ncbi:hypothetical protein DICVIV_13846 [Dictyocaulus viviparus]|uniref:Uncharacterized protein n=1 Tax=Dictyocaulus viviparus TaxID=29172 RepID=A0A0D8X6Q8_DICVI|nr:hypothetical protein DICVIV_13846 [Dictyocaulus viviparus]